ncbi:FG-GAP repeat domain-containing protein [Streptomyces luteolus]|uniref:VCBS repeat-containing protein n=1 Tax=Streptomyces luteolus TaxID=3043615 RepID=A0ABT6SSM4_9ACTN|nr:VCBS repeat-containing protein [Streptomyces sp. B-S-A12]MDI3418381.1 VCBS repeat-containing protein [Streptomyces sp. B-S-A12]
MTAAIHGDPQSSPRTSCLPGCVVLLLVVLVGVGAVQWFERDYNPGDEWRRQPAAKAPARNGPPDFDKDGYPDAVSIQRNYSDDEGPATARSAIMVFRGGPSGLRPTGRPLTPGHGTEDSRRAAAKLSYDTVLTGDFNGDGYTDVAAQRHPEHGDAEHGDAEHGDADHGTKIRSSAVILPGSPDGLRNRPVPIALPDGDRAGTFVAGAVGDIDGDGHLDLIDSGSAAGRPARVVYGPMSATGKPAQVRTFKTSPQAPHQTVGPPVVADFDQDGRTDLLIPSDYGPKEYDEDAPPTPVQYFRGTPEGPVLDTELTQQIGQHASVWTTDKTEVRTGVDFDGDGYPDILPRPGVRQILRGGPDGLREGTFPLTAEGDVGTPLLSGDVTGDEKAEFISTVHFGPTDARGRIQVAERGPGVRLRPIQAIDLDTPGLEDGTLTRGSGSRDDFGAQLQLLDANQDGHTDVLATGTADGQNPHGDYWYLPGGKDGLRTPDTHRYTRAELGLKDLDG